MRKWVIGLPPATERTQEPLPVHNPDFFQSTELSLFTKSCDFIQLYEINLRQLTNFGRLTQAVSFHKESHFKETRRTNCRCPPNRINYYFNRFLLLFHSSSYICWMTIWLSFISRSSCGIPSLISTTLMFPFLISVCKYTYFPITKGLFNGFISKWLRWLCKNT